MRWLGAFSLVRLTETMRTFFGTQAEGEDIAQVVVSSLIKEWAASAERRITHQLGQGAKQYYDRE